MKKILAFILAMLLLVPVVITSCGDDEETEEQKGPEIQMFLASIPTTIDPATSYTTTDQIRLMGLLYEGLFTVEADGELENALCKEYEYDYDERTGYLDLFITLEDSRWSDGNMVTADDFRFAWKRILLPENHNPNASLLFPILNAKKVKEGLCGEDDFGVYAIDSKTLQISFEKEFLNEDLYNDDATEIQVEYFLRRLASPSLVPLRQDIVDDSTKDWCTQTSNNLVTNGPFKIKAWNSGELTFERNVNYRCVGDDENNSDDEIVKPYRLVTLYSEGGSTADGHIAKFDNEECFYVNLNSASNDSIRSHISDIQSDNLLSTYCLYLDLSHDLFKDERVRKALSMSLDRLTYAIDTFNSPATGYVPAGIEDAAEDSDFRKVGGTLISPKADIEGAKQLLAEAGIDPAGQKIIIDFTGDTYLDTYLAEKVIAAWTELGFTVSSFETTQKFIDSKENGSYPLNQRHERAGEAVAVLVNLQSQTTDAYSILTALSSEYGGTIVDVTLEDVVHSSHVTGFDDKTYNDIISKFIYAKSDEYRVALMHKAEEYVVSKMPVIPLVFNRGNYISQELSEYKTDKFGRLNFIELEYEGYEEEETEDESDE